MANIYDMVDVWNASGTTFTAIKMNVTDTASAAASNLLDLQVGGVSRFKVQKDGQIDIPQITGLVSSGNPTLRFIPNSGVVMGLEPANSGSAIMVKADTTSGLVFRGTAVDFASNGRIGWTLGVNSPLTTIDLILARDAAGTLAQRNGTNAQAFNLYNTFTDASNYERGFMKWDSNTLKIGTEKLGTGTARALEFQTDGVTRVTLTAVGGLAINSSVTINNGISLSVGNAYIFDTRGRIVPNGDGVFNLLNNAQSGFGRLQFGGATSSFPALKRDTTSLQARLADDSAFTNIQGKLTTETAYTAGAPTATGYIVLYDSTGTAYKVPAEAL